MNLITFLGVLAFMTSSLVFLGEVLIAEIWLQQTTGMTWDLLRPYAGLLLCFGLVALWMRTLTSPAGRQRLKYSARRQG